jgi:hypothetical protein
MAAAVALLFCSVATAAGAETARGTWNLTNVHGRLELQLHWRSPDGRDNNDHSSYVDAQALGIANALNSSGQHATFASHREAGDFAFEGWLGNGEGAGSYTFTPNDAFFSSLRNRGYDITTMDYKMAFADLDITMNYVNEMESLGFKGDVSHLIALKALNVSRQYVQDLQAAGVTDITTSQIISLRAVHVDREYVKEIAGAGFPHLSADQYVTLKAMHVDAAYIRYLRSHGFKNLTVDQVVGMKAQRI